MNSTSKILRPVSTAAWILAFFLLVFGLLATALGFVTMFFPAMWGVAIDNLTESQKYLIAVNTFEKSLEHELFTNSTMKVTMKSEKRLSIPVHAKLSLTKSRITFAGTSEKELGKVESSSFSGNFKVTDQVRGELIIRTPSQTDTKVKKGNETILKFMIPKTRVTEVDVVCKDTNGCTNMSSNNCAQGMTYFGSSTCTYNSLCGKCRLKSYLTRICLLLDLSQTWKLSTDQGCYYPFDSPGEYGIERPERIAMNVLSHNDPLIMARNITKGTMDFTTSDDKPEDERKRLTFFLIGGAVVLVGLIVTLISICLLTSFWRRSMMARQQPVRRPNVPQTVPQSPSPCVYVASPPTTTEPQSSPVPPPTRPAGKNLTSTDSIQQGLVDSLNAVHFEDPLRSSSLRNMGLAAKAPRESFSDML